MMKLRDLAGTALLAASLLLIRGAVMGAPAASPASPETDEFFEKQVRPVLANNCYSCHGSKQQMGGLRLDTMAGALKGSDNGAVIVKGEPEKSRLVQAIHYTGDLKMPPAGKLHQEQIDALVQWVKLGAPWPGTKPAPVQAAPQPNAAASPGDYVITPEQHAHWSFLPVKNPALPKVKNEAWIKSPVDRFVLAKLEAKGLQPSPPADKLTLLRRVTLDLIGLPPTPAEITAFLNDHSPTAFAKVVDRLLASPHYGERWGRHWLDVARYADTRGYVFVSDTNYPNAYTYRDYVIRAFNEDLPYDQFILQQLAADRLPLGEDKRPLAAMGYLTLGRRFLNNSPDIIDDRIDVTTRGFMGLTVSCARCHNHKFDPIPTADYYSLYSIFASSDEPDPVSISPPDKTRPYEAYQTRLQGVKKPIRDAISGQMDRLVRQSLPRLTDYFLASAEIDRDEAKNSVEAEAKTRDLNPLLLRKWHDFLKGRDASDSVMGPWHEYAALSEADFAHAAPSIAEKWKKNAESLNTYVRKALEGDAPATLKDAAERYARLFQGIEADWDKLQAGPNPSGQLPDGPEELLRQLIQPGGGIYSFSSDDAEPYFEPEVRKRILEGRKEMEAILKSPPPTPDFAMTLADAPSPFDGHVFLRGNPGNPGPAVPRRFLQILSGDSRSNYDKGSGRLELAKAIASKDNPLTARVMVNRVWLHHFGYGLVRTPGDFGFRGEPPSHPELLDYLAARFVNDGWSIKKLHRLILLSSAYQQGSKFNAKAHQIDPENRLLWRMNRLRLELEPLRDSMLAVGGPMDAKVGGPSVDILNAPFSHRRSLYGYIDRQNLPGFFRTFDLASPDATSAQRYLTVVPQQALFMMNSPFVVEQARSFAARKEIAAIPDPRKRIQRMYLTAYGRWATPDEIQIGLEFLQSNDPTGEGVKQAPPVWQYGYGEFDEKTNRVTAFAPLPHWTGEVWQGGPELPDPKLNWLMLNREGGHPGPDASHAVIRRWVAPKDAVVSMGGTLKHGSGEGDGVRARIISSRSGMAGQWTAHNSEAETKVERIEVKAGDTLDFVVECQAENSFDSFEWSPVIKDASGMSGKASKWSSAEGFSGPPAAPPHPLSVWERYAQVLMETNEFAFVD